MWLFFMPRIATFTLMSFKESPRVFQQHRQEAGPSSIMWITQIVAFDTVDAL